MLRGGGNNYKTLSLSILKNFKNQRLNKTPV